MKTKRTIETRIKTARDAEAHDLEEVQNEIDALDDGLLSNGDEVETEKLEFLCQAKEQITAKWKTYTSALEWAIEG